MLDHYTDPNGVTIRRLPSGSFRATCPGWPRVLRSPTGTNWYSPDGDFICDDLHDKAACAAWYNWEKSNESPVTSTPDPDGLTPTERKAVEGAIEDARSGLAVYLQSTKYEKIDGILQNAGVFGQTIEEGSVFAYEKDLDSDDVTYTNVIWNAATGERTVPEPKTYTDSIGKWPTGLYLSADIDFMIAHFGEGVGLVMYPSGKCDTLRMTTVTSVYTRVDDLDPSLLFTGGKR